MSNTSNVFFRRSGVWLTIAAWALVLCLHLGGIAPTVSASSEVSVGGEAEFGRLQRRLFSFSDEDT